MNYKNNEELSTEQSALIYFIWAARPHSIRCKTHDSLFRFVVSLEPDKQKTLLALSDSPSTVICLTTGPKPLPKRFLHILVVRSRASSFNWQYPLLSLSSSSSFLRLLSPLLVTSICPYLQSSFAIILIIPIASLIPFPLLNPNWSYPSTSSIFFSILLLSIFAIFFAVCAIRLIVR